MMIHAWEKDFSNHVRHLQIAVAKNKVLSAQSKQIGQKQQCSSIKGAVKMTADRCPKTLGAPSRKPTTLYRVAVKEFKSSYSSKETV